MTDNLHIVDKDTYSMAEVMEIISSEMVLRDLEMELRRNGTVETRLCVDGEWYVFSMPDPTGAMSYVADAIGVLDECEECDALYEVKMLLTDAMTAYQRHCPDVTVTIEDEDGE